MKFWLMTPWTSASDMIVLAQQAESLGFEGIMGADHGFVPQQMAAGYPYSDDGTPRFTAAYYTPMCGPP